MQLVSINAANYARNRRRPLPEQTYRKRRPADADRRGLSRAGTLVLACCVGLAGAKPGFAASGELMDTVATGLAIFIIVALPIAFIVLFWLVHVLPEKIAEKRHHPQKDAIHVLCLLSLVFGGLLWPLAWLWAYTRPVFHQLAYGRDKHEDFYTEASSEVESRVPSVPVPAEPAGETETGLPTVTVEDELARLRRELDELERRGASPEAVRDLRGRLTQFENRPMPGNVGGGLR